MSAADKRRSGASQDAADITGIAQLGDPDSVAEMLVDGDDAAVQARLERAQAEVVAYWAGSISASVCASASITRATVTREQAEAVLAAVKKQFASYVLAADGNPDDLPRLVWDFHREDGVVGPAIVWESNSPYEWAYLFPGGGVDEEMVTLASDVVDAKQAAQVGTVDPVELPDGVEVQAELSYVLAIYPPYQYD